MRKEVGESERRDAREEAAVPARKSYIRHRGRDSSTVEVAGCAEAIFVTSAGRITTTQ